MYLFVHMLFRIFCHACNHITRDISPYVVLLSVAMLSHLMDCIIFFTMLSHHTSPFSPCSQKCYIKLAPTSRPSSSTSLSPLTSPAVLPPPSLAPLELPVPTLFHLASPTERAPGAWRLAAPGGTVRGQRCRCTCGRPFITRNAEVVAVARVSQE